MNYATITDVTTLFRTLSSDEQTKVTAYLPLISAALRAEAKKVGKDLDGMVNDDVDIKAVAKEICVKVMVRILSANHDGEQISEITTTYTEPNGEIYFKTSELKRLGIKKQRISAIDPYLRPGVEKWGN